MENTRRTASTCSGKISPSVKAADSFRNSDSRAWARLISREAAAGDWPEAFSFHCVSVRVPEERQLLFLSIARSIRPRTAPRRETSLASASASARSSSPESPDRSSWFIRDMSSPIVSRQPATRLLPVFDDQSLGTPSRAPIDGAQPSSARDPGRCGRSPCPSRIAGRPTRLPDAVGPAATEFIWPPNSLWFLPSLRFLSPPS